MRLYRSKSYLLLRNILFLHNKTIKIGQYFICQYSEWWNYIKGSEPYLLLYNFSVLTNKTRTLPNANKYDN